MSTGNEKDELAARIGAAVRERRKSAKMTLSDVSRTAGMSVSHLSNVENGLTLVSLPMLAKLASALGTSLADLTRDDNFVFRGAAIPTTPGQSERLSHPSLVIEADGIALEDGATWAVEPHRERDLFVYVLEGDMEIDLDGQLHRLSVGDAVDARAPGSAVIRALTSGRLFCATAPAVRTS